MAVHLAGYRHRGLGSLHVLVTSHASAPWATSLTDFCIGKSRLLTRVSLTLVAVTGTAAGGM